MEYPDVNDDIYRIETLVTKLREIDPTRRGIDPFDPDYDRASEILLAQHLDFLERPKDISRLYRKVEIEECGGAAHVWKAILAEDRPLAGLKVGAIIAIRVTGCIPKPFRNSYGSLVGFEALIRLSHFKNLKTGEQPITDYFPNFYGVYYADKMPDSLVEGKYPDFLKSYEKSYFRYEEMEWVDTTFEKKYHAKTKEIIPDSVLFEFMYGEWAGRFFYGLSIADNKYRNYGLKTVCYDRVYHLGEDVYSFSSNQMPVRLDLESFCSYPLPSKSRFCTSKIEIADAETQNGRCFLTELSERRFDVFALFKKHFSAYLINPVKADQQPSAKHFYLDQKQIDQERSLPMKLDS